VLYILTVRIYNPNVTIAPGRLDELLAALERQLRAAAGPPTALVICGGSALAALGLVIRTTRDVDVLGTASLTPAGVVVQPLLELPEPLAAAVRRVSRDFNLPEDWLNTGPARQTQAGLPEGLAQRLVRRDYGPALSAWFISRIDQVHLKLYAAVDRDGYHTDDLLALKPDRAELLNAARWTMTQDVSAPFRESLKSFLVAHDYVDVAEQV
jgi:hypothetical protein